MSAVNHGSMTLRACARYVIALLLGTATCLVALGTAIWITDPLHRFVRSEQDKAFCDARMAAGPSAWFMKSIILNSRKYDAIIVGSSKYFYVDPSLLNYFQFVNASIGSSTPEFMYELLDAHARDVSVVVLALDFFMFNEARFPYGTDEQLEEIRRRFRETGTSRSLLQVFNDSLIGKFFSDTSYLLSAKAVELISRRIPTDKRWTLPRGNWNISAWLDAIKQEENAGPPKISRASYDYQLNVLRSSHYTPYAFSKRRVEMLRKIRDLMARRGVTLLVQINPVNIEDKQLIDSLPARSDFEVYRQAVNQVFPDAADFSSTAYADPKDYFNWDPIHPLPTFAAKLVNDRLEKIATPEQRLRNESRAKDLPDSIPTFCN